MLPRARVLAMLRTLGKRNGSVAVAEIRTLPDWFYESLLHHFGSIDAARKTAGVPAPPPPNLRWTRETMIAEVRRAHRRGLRITSKDLELAGLRGLANAIGKYGGFVRVRRMCLVPELPRRLYERTAWDDDLVISEIRALHREGKSLAHSKAPSKLVNAAMRHFGSWKDAVEVAGFDYDRVRLLRAPYTRAELLDEMRKLAKRAPRMSLAKLHRYRAAEAWIRMFGSIEAAARAAGITGWPPRAMGPLYSAQKVVAGVRRRHRERSPLSAAVVEDDDGHLYRSAIRHFGSWPAALEAARLPASAIKAAIHRHTWTKQEVISALRERKRAGKSMTVNDLRADDPSLHLGAKRHLGYNAKVATRDWGAPRLVTHWTKRALLAALRESHTRGTPMSGAWVAAAGTLFGSASAARRAARVPELRRTWTDERVVDEIRALNGDKADSTLVSIAQRRFGSWRAALEAAGQTPKVRTWDADSVRDALQARVARGLALDPTSVRRDHSSLFYAIRTRFGDIKAALRRFEQTATLPPEIPRARPGRPAGDARAGTTARR